MFLRRAILPLLFFFSTSVLAIQDKVMDAVRILSPPLVDGLLKDECWKNISPADHFIQLRPYPGMPSWRKTEIKVAYDDDALYVGAMMYDSPDSILRQLYQRDGAEDGNADAFAVLFDSYHNRQNAYLFEVSPAGVQSDIKYSGDEVDMDWNAVWQSAVKIVDSGWCAEFRIPWSALRFPKVKRQDWGVNFMRNIRRYREYSWWNPVAPEIAGIVNQEGTLKGIENINSPVRLSFSPYVSLYAEHYPYNIPGKQNLSWLYSGGMDVKYGLSKSFTLDMTLVPDFSQVQSDNRVLNLSPFEVYYQEKRPFFMEGTELFNKAEIFYSRRIGLVSPDKLPSDQLGNNEIFLSLPEQARLYNATKISGRTRQGTGIGFFNATSAPVDAIVLDTASGRSRLLRVQPLTNYNVSVMDQTFGRNSNFSLINTNVTRASSGNENLTGNANVTGTQFKLADKTNTFAFAGLGALSQVYNAGNNNSDGFKYRVALMKISGHYQAALNERVVSNTYDQNDLGYLAKNNEFVHSFENSYHIYNPFWIINNTHFSAGIEHKMLYSPRRFRDINLYWNTETTFRNYLTSGVFGDYYPEKSNYDFYEPRTTGRFYIYPSNILFGYFYSSDYRKKLALDFTLSERYFAQPGRYTIDYFISPRFRVSDRLMLIYSFNGKDSYKEVGFVDNPGDTIVFGIRNVSTLSHELNAKYIFSSRTGFSFRLRHYHSRVLYSSYHILNEDGSLSPPVAHANSDIDFNLFNLDLIYTWYFAPGSELDLVWKNSIYGDRNKLTDRYLESLSRTFESPQLNSFSLKVLYYLDYQMLRKKLNGA